LRSKEMTAMKLLRFVLAIAACVVAAGCAHGASPLPPGGADARIASGSDRSALAPFASGVPAGSLGTVRFAVALPLRNEAELLRFLADVSNPRSAGYAHFLSREQFLARYAPSPGDLAAVASELRGAGFQVSVSDQAVHAGGTRAQVERYFLTRLTPEVSGGFVRTASLRVSRTLQSRGARVVGFEPLRFHVDSRRLPLPAGARPDNFSSPAGPYYTTDLKQAYQYPSYQDVTGSGVTIGILMASPIERADIVAYFHKLHLSVSPQITNQSVAGGGSYDPTSDNTSEATLDVEQSLGMAPQAKGIVFNIPSLSGGDVYDGYGAIVANPAVKVVNASFGLCESANSFLDYQPYEQLFVEGTAEGQTFVASSGDFANASCGANAAGRPNVEGVQWPASSIYQLAVGGTNLKTQNVARSNASGYVSEEAYQDDAGGGAHWGSGGGFSTPGYFPRQSWQVGFDPRPERGVPDVALHMGGCPGYAVLPCNPNDSADYLTIDGSTDLVIGTSAAAPDIAGLIALGIQGEHQPQGFGDIHVLIYLSASEGVWRSGIPGNNGYRATGGSWNPVLGIGTPITAYKIAGTTRAAGVPGTASNP
jgi:kumamolisin